MPFLEQTEEPLEEALSSILRPTFYTSQAAARAMVERGGGGAILHDLRATRQSDGRLEHAISSLAVLGCQAEVIPLDPSSLDEVLDGVLQVGKAAGVEQRAGEVVGRLRERLALFHAAVEGLERPRVFALEWGIRRSTAATGCRRCWPSLVASRCWPVRAPRRCG